MSRIPSFLLTLVSCGLPEFLQPQLAPDRDQDGFQNDVDCDDSNPLVYPFSPETMGETIDSYFCLDGTAMTGPGTTAFSGGHLDARASFIIDRFGTAFTYEYVPDINPDINPHGKYESVGAEFDDAGVNDIIICSPNSYGEFLLDDPTPVLRPK
jgi:hypothetical protein